MKPLLYAAGGLGVVAIAFFVFRPSAPPEVLVRTRTVAFDNVYGVDQLVVQLKLDGYPEETVNATCDAKTCTFDVLLINGRHELELSVQQNGRRSAPTRVTVDTTALP
jgi:hypothetical protein